MNTPYQDITKVGFSKKEKKKISQKSAIKIHSQININFSFKLQYQYSKKQLCLVINVPLDISSIVVCHTQFYLFIK